MNNPTQPQAGAQVQDELMDPRTCAGYLKVSVLTLADWRVKRIGPDFLKLGAAVRYRVSEVESWLSLRSSRKGA